MGRFSRLILLLVLVCPLAAPAAAAIPPPSDHFGFRMGADRKLVEWDDLVRYFRILDRESTSIRVTELGKSTEGRPFLMATIASPATLASLERFRDIQTRLADPRLTTPRQAEALIAQGKPVVLITCSIHSTEVASTLTAIEFAYRLLTEESPRHRAILDNTIFLLTPSLNPDGVDKVAEWYKRYLGTPYEGASMVELYHKYTGHDDNRVFGAGLRTTGEIFSGRGMQVYFVDCTLSAAGAPASPLCNQSRESNRAGSSPSPPSAPKPNPSRAHQAEPRP